MTGVRGRISAVREWGILRLHLPRINRGKEANYVFATVHRRRPLSLLNRSIWF